MIRGGPIAVTVLTALALPMTAQQTLPARTITVTVNQTVPLVPDTAFFELRVSTSTLRSPDEVAVAVSQAGLQADFTSIQSFCRIACTGRGSAVYPVFVFQLQRKFSELAATLRALESQRAALTSRLDLVDYRFSLISVEYGDAQVNQAETQVRNSLEAAARQRAASLASAAGLRLGEALVRSNTALGFSSAWFNTAVTTVAGQIGVFGSFLLGYVDASAISAVPSSSGGGPGIIFTLSAIFTAE